MTETFSFLVVPVQTFRWSAIVFSRAAMYVTVVASIAIIGERKIGIGIAAIVVAIVVIDITVILLIVFLVVTTTLKVRLVAHTSPITHRLLIDTQPVADLSTFALLTGLFLHVVIWYNREQSSGVASVAGEKHT